MNDNMFYHTDWRIDKYSDTRAHAEGRPYEVSEFEGNLLLNEGIAEMLLLTVGGGGTAFSNANAYLGVGDSTTAAAATQTGLQAASNKFYNAMDATYPINPPTGQQLVFRSTFESAEANFAWNEFTVANGNSDAAKNLNRKVSAQGTKSSGQVWILTLTITFS